MNQCEYSTVCVKRYSALGVGIICGALVGYAVAVRLVFYMYLRIAYVCCLLVPGMGDDWLLTIFFNFYFLARLWYHILSFPICF